ncbi:MAG: hypothetical protein A2428_16325 [Bdellovibrionales bacterium RIFOXYC1_FULL_54_43]|nr:MAG: hypothetical protein A2428_16325 [Bdellovibrionales bacterium RIFOXYC1_FULL_54_43]OFZ83967.1 MAG: hypothetical protein A2603_10470 [Bdellovibrionales bacterium RIFOXYD1_FULL_55_31]
MRKKIIMVYPLQGFSGTFVKHAPISLLYASADVVKAGYEVKILDARLHPNTWKKKLAELMDDETLLVGISVMSGKPILYASEISHFVKQTDPAVKVVWGGPHATFQPGSIMEYEANCDYVVSGYGSYPFKCLVDHLVEGKEPSSVQGVSYRKDGTIHTVPKLEAFEVIPYQDIPYDLISDYRVYGHIGEDRLIFSMYSVLGCPYQCSFCSSPAQYRSIEGKKWVPLTVKDVADHIEHVVKKYGANFIYFIDDDSFVKLDHVEGIIDEIQRRNINVKLGFRGARISEIKRMSDEFLSKLASAGTNIMHIGAESGSDRILKMIRKNCTVEDIIECNRKLARHPEIIAGYNIIMGLPTETLEELKQTRDLILQLVKDHPNCIIFQPNKFRPLPDTELFNVAVRDWNYAEPKTLRDWANIEVEGDYTAPWMTPEMKKFCDMMLISSYFVDRKAQKITKGSSLTEVGIRMLDHLYGPIARFRFKNGIDRVLLEYTAYNLVQKLGRHVGSLVGKSGQKT